MRHPSWFLALLLTALGFFAGLGVEYLARSSRTGIFAQRDARAADLAAIEKIHQADIAATLTQDSGALATLWSDEGINLGFPGAPVVGTKAMEEAYTKFKAENPDFHVLKYAPEIRQVQLLDGWAIEVGDTVATYKMSAKDDPVTVEEKGMRVLKRQKDGAWKFAVVGLK